MTVLCGLITAAGCNRTDRNHASDEMVLHHSLFSKVKTLDPAAIQDIPCRIVASQIFEPLYQYHFLKRPYELVPLLAEQMPEISQDQLTYTIRIKRSVRFHNDPCFKDAKGRELTSRDFVLALKRIADIKNLSPSWSVFDGRIHGLDDFRRYTTTCAANQDVDYSRPVEGLQTPDDYTLVIRLTKPWPQLPHVLADVCTAPVAHEAVESYGQDLAAHPVGTGPFRLARWDRASYIELVRNHSFRLETYPAEGEPIDAAAGYLDDAGKPLPFADRVIWTIIEESQPAWMLLLQGKIGAMSIPKDSFSRAFTATGQLSPQLQQRNIHLQTFADPSTFWLGFNAKDPLLGPNKPLRQAISLAIDRCKFIELFTNNRDEVAYGLIPPVMDSYDLQIKQQSYARYDPNQARLLLVEAEKIYGGSLPQLHIAIPGTDTWMRQYGQFLTRCLAAIGLDVRAEYMDRPSYLERANTGTLELFAWGFTAKSPDAQEFLMMFYSKNTPPGPNTFNYCNPRFDELFEESQLMPDCPQRRRLYRRMEDIILDDCPAAFINHRVAYVLCHDWYRNYKPHTFAYNLSKYRRVDMAGYAAYQQRVKEIQ